MKFSRHNTVFYLGVFAPFLCLSLALAKEACWPGPVQWLTGGEGLNPSGPIWASPSGAIWMETATCKALPGANDMDNDKNALYAMKLSDCWDWNCEGLMKIGSAWVKRVKSDEVI